MIYLFRTFAIILALICFIGTIGFLFSDVKTPENFLSVMVTDIIVAFCFPVLWYDINED